MSYGETWETGPDDDFHWADEDALDVHPFVEDDEGYCFECGNHREHDLHRRNFRVVPKPEDPEPLPSDGPDYHADHAAWSSRQEPAVQEESK